MKRLSILHYVDLYLIQSNILVAMGSAFLSLETMLLYTNHISFLIVFYIFISTWIAYSILRTSNIKKYHYFILFVYFLLSLLILKKFRMLIFLLVGILVLFYPFFRKLPFIKIWLVSLCWAIFTGVFPLSFPYFIKVIVEPRYWIYFIVRFLFIFAIVIPFDVKDIFRDQKIGLKTIPISMGETRSIFFSIGLLVFNLILMVIYGRFFLFLLFNHIYTILLLINFDSSKPDIYVTGLIESTMITEFLFYQIFEIWFR